LCRTTGDAITRYLPTELLGQHAQLDPTTHFNQRAAERIVGTLWPAIAAQ
jgi:hypothetical protein